MLARLLNQAVPKKQNKSTGQEPRQKDYERIGRIIESVLLHGYADRKRLLWMTFFKGIVYGVGTVIGATILIGILLWILSALDTIPLVGPIFESIEQSIESPEIAP